MATTNLLILPGLETNSASNVTAKDKMLYLGKRAMFVGIFAYTEKERLTRFFFTTFHPISPHKNSVLSQTDRCSWGLLLVVAGARILSDAQNVTVTVSGLRSYTSITTPLISPVVLLCVIVLFGVNHFPSIKS
jgi:hypothetical protein